MRKMMCNSLCCVAVAKCQPAQQQRWTNAQVRTYSVLLPHIIYLFIFVWCTWWPGVAFRFVRRLLFFYKPSSKLYAGLELDHSKAKQLTVVGCQFIEFLLESDEVKEGKRSCSHDSFVQLFYFFIYYLDAFLYIRDCFVLVCLQLSNQDGHVYLEDLVKDVVQWLSSSSGLKPDRSLQSNGLLNTLSQHYFLFLGALSAHPSGVKLLEKCSVFQWWVKSHRWGSIKDFREIQIQLCSITDTVNVCGKEY